MRATSNRFSARRIRPARDGRTARARSTAEGSAAPDAVKTVRKERNTGWGTIVRVSESVSNPCPFLPAKNSKASGLSGTAPCRQQDTWEQVWGRWPGCYKQKHQQREPRARGHSGRQAVNAGPTQTSPRRRGSRGLWCTAPVASPRLCDGGSQPASVMPSTCSQPRPPVPVPQPAGPAGLSSRGAHRPHQGRPPDLGPRRSGAGLSPVDPASRRPTEARGNDWTKDTQHNDGMRARGSVQAERRL